MTTPLTDAELDAIEGRKAQVRAEGEARDKERIGSGCGKSARHGVGNPHRIPSSRRRLGGVTFDREPGQVVRDAAPEFDSHNAPEESMSSLKELINGHAEKAAVVPPKSSNGRCCPNGRCARCRAGKQAPTPIRIVPSLPVAAAPKPTKRMGRPPIVRTPPPPPHIPNDLGRELAIAMGILVGLRDLDAAAAKRVLSAVGDQLGS